MTLSLNRRQFSMSAATLAIAATMIATPSARQKAPAPTIVPAVASARLAPFLPTLPGWTRGVVDADTVVLSPTCNYTYTYAVYTNADATIRMTVADTGFDPGGLGALATMVVTFPEGYSGQIPPATSINRQAYKGSSAALLNDKTTGEVEFTVVINGRFVVKADGKSTSIDQLRAAVDVIDLTALAALK